MDGSRDQFTDMGDDWWRDRRVCQKVSHWLGKHLLGLLLSVRIDGEHQHCVYTGFLLYHLDHLLWASAGHVIDKIHRVLSNPTTEVIAMRWLDDYGPPGAKSIPVNHRNLHLFSLSESDIDFGVMIISPLECENMLANPDIAIVGEEAWQREPPSHRDGYYLLGYPKEWTSSTQDSLADGSVRRSVLAELACLPVERIEHPGPAPRGGFWAHPEAFYGQIVPFSGESDPQPVSIKGMSGGLVLSIERDLVSDGVGFGLVGVQGSWLRRSRKIRAEPMPRIMSRIGEATELE